MLPLGDLGGPRRESVANAVSGDGTIVVGQAEVVAVAPAQREHVL